MNHTGNAVSRPSPLSALSRAEWLCLALVVMAHVLPVGWLLCGSAVDAPEMTPPIAGVLVSGSGGTGGGAAGRTGDASGSGRHGKAMDDNGRAMPAPKSETKKAPPPSRAERALANRTAVSTPLRQTMPVHDAVAPTDKAAAAGSALPAASRGGKAGDTGSGGTGTSGDGGGSGQGSGTGGSGHGSGNGSGFSGPDGSGFSNPKPPYPAISRRMGEEGLVVLSVYILADGTVGEVSIHKSSGFRRLDESALKTVRRWRYAPAKRHGKPVAIRYAQPIRFSLND